MRTMLRVAVLAAVMFAGLAATPAGAHHARIYGPCDIEYGFVHMTYDEWAARITSLEADGTIPPGVVFRYYEALHGGKGKDDPRIMWARGLFDGQILSIDDWANGNHPEIEQLMFDSGRVAEWQLDANYDIRRFDDPFWAQRNPVFPTWTVWQTLCMASFPVSKPAYEVVDGEWVSNLPTTTTTTTTTTVPATTTTVPATTTTVPATTTTTTLAFQGYELPDGYDLWDAQYDGWPFEQTILALEARYPPGTPGKKHFPLSAAVRFLRLGGKVGGLDLVWGSGA